MVEKEEAGGGISEEEAAQYDRQIRLWGLEAQKRLRASRVLLVGMKGLGAEIAKNLILAGVKGLTMLDHEQVSPEGAGAQFLIRTGSVGRNRAEASLERAQNLNPMVDVKVDTEDIEKKPESFFTQFDAVCLTCCSRDVIVKVDQICHKNSIKFFTGDVFGYHGYTFANLGEHEFVEVPGHGQPTGLQVDYVFRAVEHVVRVVVSGQALELEVEDRMTADQWRGEFDASFVEDLTHKTGNFKQFNIFCNMLESALTQSSESVTLDLLTYTDLESLRSRKLGGRPGALAPRSAQLNSKRYLILIYSVEFDRIHYPLPLPYQGKPDPVVLQGIIRTLKEELGCLRGLDRGQNPRDTRETEIWHLREHCPKGQTAVIPMFQKPREAQGLSPGRTWNRASLDFGSGSASALLAKAD